MMKRGLCQSLSNQSVCKKGTENIYWAIFYAKGDRSYLNIKPIEILENKLTIFNIEVKHVSDAHDDFYRRYVMNEILKQIVDKSVQLVKNRALLIFDLTLMI